MRASLLVSVLALLSLPRLFSQPTHGINLAGICAFRPGDDDTWRSKYIDERENWNFIRAPGAWERNGYSALDGYAWYRIRFQIPKDMRDDSLVLVIDGIDDVDQTFLNGWLVGSTGTFPPHARSEIRTIRIYPLPKRTREDFNVLAIRVYDAADSGGIDGQTMKIVRQEDLESTLRALPQEQFHPPSLFLSNGQCLASLNPSTNTIETFYPHVFHELETGLFTENILTKLTLGIELNGKKISLDTIRADRTEYYQNTSIIHQSFLSEFDLFWYIPRTTGKKILIILLQSPRDLDLENVGLSVILLKPTIAYREIKKHVAGSSRHYFILSYNSCCKEFAERDLDEFLRGVPLSLYKPEDIETEMMYWGKIRAALRIPSMLNDDEIDVFKQSASLLVMAQNNEVGVGSGQIVSAMQPAQKKYCMPHDHFLSTEAFAAAGLVDASKSGLDFIARTDPHEYIFYDVYGAEYGIGLPYQVTPAKYLGIGAEYQWTNKEDAVFTHIGFGSYLRAVNTYILQKKRDEARFGRIVSDSSIIHPLWQMLSRKVADVIMERVDSTHLVYKDAGRWGSVLTKNYNIVSSLYAAVGLRTAARFAAIMRDTLRTSIYKVEAEKIVTRIESLIDAVEHKSSDEELTPMEMLVFDPLLIEGINLGLFAPKSRSARFALELAEKSFRCANQKNSYLAQPDGDWFERQERPYIALLLASAYARNGNRERAEELFRHVTQIASDNYEMLPEIRDPKTLNWYGGVPAIGQGAAPYIQTAIVISELRLQQSRQNGGR